MPEPAECADLSQEGSSPPLVSSRGAIWLAVACLVGAILAAYHNSFSGPFVFDDGPAILGNPTIRNLSALGDVLSPPREGGQTVGGRPVVNLSLAVNYALGGVSARGYHVFNLIVHLLAALVLFAIARRTLLQPTLRARFGSAATPLALAIALLWAVHPLLTESVTYVIQRAESLMGLFYLLTLYCFIRGAKSEGNPSGVSRQCALAPTVVDRRCTIWLLLAVGSCALGMATKEVMVSAPLLVLLYDRTFVAGSWREAWAKRRPFYLGLGATWILLGWLVLGTEHRGGTAGLGMGDSVWTYALSQTRAIVHYLRLTLWPHPLVFDYGTEAIEHMADALPFALMVAVLMAGAAVAWWRWPAAGFLGAWFFAILAPSSSIVPIPVQPVAEHRMYLPLVAVVALVVVSLYAQWRRGCWCVFAALALALAALTVRRNEDYLNPRSIWADTVAKRPTNARAQCYLGDVLAAKGQFTEALSHYEEAIQLELPATARGDRNILGDILVNSGNVLRSLSREAEAVKRYEDALRVDPDLAAAHFNLGSVHLRAGRLPQAVDQFEQALRIDPNYVAAHANLASALLLERRPAEALIHYETALRLEPSAKAHQDLGMAFLYLRRWPEAAAHLERAVRLEPDRATAHAFLGDALAAQGRPAEAAAHYQRALQIEPGNEHARRALDLLSATGCATPQSCRQSNHGQTESKTVHGEVFQ
jgi:tetratricopeptide (TPR) repeat protein